MPVGARDHGLAAAIFGRRNLARSLAGRLEKLAGAAPHLFPQDAEKMVRLPHEERIALIKDLIEKTVREVFEFDDFIVRTLDHKTGLLEAIIARSGSGATLLQARPLRPTWRATASPATSPPRESLISSRTRATSRSG